MGKYGALTDYLSSLDGSSHRFRFTEIERILGFTLPASARKFSAWWANDATAGRHAASWLASGRYTENLDLGGETVAFARAKRGIPGPATRKPRKSKMEVAFAGLPLVDGGAVEVEIRLNWRHFGVVEIDPAGKLFFPVSPDVPALYRLRLLKGSKSQHYIGETGNLRRRFGNYRNPGPTQATSQRIHGLLHAHIEKGERIEIDVMDSQVLLRLSGAEQTVDLTQKSTRLLLEQAALAANCGSAIENLNL